MRMDFETPWPKPAREECYFYHSIDLPNGETVIGQWDLRGQWEQYTAGVNFEGLSVLDVGTASGFLAFSAERAGARHVVAMDAATLGATDRVPHRNSRYMSNKAIWCEQEEHGFNTMKKGFWYSWHSFRSKVDVYYGSIQNLLSVDNRFDIVMAGAMLYHVSDPVTALGAFCRVAKETVVLPCTSVEDSDEEFMSPLEPWDEPKLQRGIDFTWWTPSRGLFNRVFRNMGFEASYHPCTARDCHGNVVHYPTIVARRRSHEGV